MQDGEMSTLALPSVEEGAPPSRVSSAPPVMELQSNNLFAFHQSRSGVVDIRCDEQYQQFYQQYNVGQQLQGGRAALPMPLEAPFDQGMRINENFSGQGGTPTSTGIWKPLASQQPMSRMDPQDHSGYPMPFKTSMDMHGSLPAGSPGSLASSPGMPPQFHPSFLDDDSPAGSPTLPFHHEAFGAPTGGQANLPGPFANPAVMGSQQSSLMQQMGMGMMPMAGGYGAMGRNGQAQGKQKMGPQINGVCRYYLQGHCNRGSRCHFSHVVEMPGYGFNQPGMAAPQVQPKKRGRQQQAQHYATPQQRGRKQGQVTVAHQVRYNGPSNASQQQGARVRNGSTSPRGGVDDAELVERFGTIDDVKGQIFALCQDQHGCRFLQKMLVDRDTYARDLIFDEVHESMPPLMMDPFGNYLCQKLFECCTDEQRAKIVTSVAPEIVKISLNVHGTRAVQKMIEYLSTSDERMVQQIIDSLRNSVVVLIKDLNGNHVIQRCLNRLKVDENQFIFDAVSDACVEVATHRHGCCVMQRCLDHASHQQQMQLGMEIVHNALELVQDAFGNYVVQYILDLNRQVFGAEVTSRFAGHIADLSAQKFSSNVIEKCLKNGDEPTRTWIVEELVESDILPRLLQDPYANYVVQTALAVANPTMHGRLVNAIRPHSHVLKNTPYGKRIMAKIGKAK